MSILCPSPGELVDRLTILGLKIVNGRRKGVDVTLWDGEQRDINAKLDLILSGGFHPSVARDDGLHRMNALRDDLRKVNSRLWALEDEVRALPEVAPEFTENQPANLLRLADLAKLIPYMNDNRAKLVGQIDELFGLKVMPKLYNNT